MQEITKDTERIPHTCLICAPSMDLAVEKAKELASIAVCSGYGKKPCGHCRDCRKVNVGIHPDVLTISRPMDEKGKTKQNITVDQIRALSADAVILPNEASQKVYIIREAESMNLAAQNAALKLLEEPPSHVVFLLCSVRPMQLLETVRSRCSFIKLKGDTVLDSSSSVALDLASGYVKVLNTHDLAQIYRWCVQNEDIDAQTMAAFLEALRERLTAAIVKHPKSCHLSNSELFHIYQLSIRCSNYLRVNTNVKQLFGLLAVKALPHRNRGNIID